MLKLPKIKGWKWKLLFFAGFALAVGLFWVFELPCVWKELFHTPCLGCGLTRAYKCLFKGDVKGAFEWHFMFWSAPIFVWAILFDGKLTGRKGLDIAVYVLLAIGFFIRWIIWFL